MTDPANGHTERLRALERIVAQQGTDLARVDAQTSSNTELIRAMGPLVAQLATVAEAQRHLQSGMDNLMRDWKDDVQHFDNEIEKIRAGQAQEARDSKMYRRTLVGVAMAAVLSPICTLVIALTFHAP